MTATGRAPLRLVARQTDIPDLSWCVLLEAGSDRVRLDHGPGVEVRDGAFFEGAWGGDFAGGRFDKAAVFSGSGGRLGENGLVLATPTDTLERLYLLRRSDRLVVANSLALLLEATGEELDPRYPFYLRDLGSIQLGLRRCRTRIPTRAGRRVELLAHENATVAADLSLRRRPKAGPPPFPGYEAYVSFLAESVTALAANAADPARKRSYRLLASLSGGYDSPACAVLARDAGCREAIGFGEARTEFGEFSDPDDSGRELAALLGLEFMELERTAWRAAGAAPEAEFLACGCGGSDVVFAAAERLLHGRLLVLGSHGDQVWARRPDSLSPHLVRGGVGGSSFGEFRRRVGFLILPLPFAGATRVAEINAITRSKALRPWRLGGSYDRPIARRLLEEAGVPRGSFAREKRAVGQPFTAVAGYRKFHDLPLDRTLSPEGFARFETWLARHRHDPRLRDRLRLALGRWLTQVRLPLAPKTERRLERRGWGQLGRPLVADRTYGLSFTRQDWLTAWAVEEVRPRYAAARALREAADRRGRGEEPG